VKTVQIGPQLNRKTPAAATPGLNRSKANKAQADFALEVVSASVPRHIVVEVKNRVGKRGFSQFVTRSLERELQRENQRSFIAEAEAAVGPIDARSLARAERLLRS
jgi:hypothetical protein